MWNMKFLMDGIARTLPILLNRQDWKRRVKIHGIMEMIPGSLVIEASGTMGRRCRKVDRVNLQEMFEAFYQWWNEKSVESMETQSAPPGVGGSGASGADSAADRVKPGDGRRTRQRTSGTEQAGDRRHSGRPRGDPPGEPGGDDFGQGRGNDHGGRRGQAPRRPYRSGDPDSDGSGPPSDDPGRSGGG